MTEQEFAQIAGYASLAGIKDAASLTKTLKGEGEDELTLEEAHTLLPDVIKSKAVKGRGDQLKRGHREKDNEHRKALASKLPKLAKGIDADNFTDFLDQLSERASVLSEKKATDSSPAAPAEITPELLASSPIATDYFNKQYNRKMEADRKELKDAKEALERERKEAQAATVRSKLTTAVAKRAKEMGVALDVEGVPTGLRLQKMLELQDFRVSNWKIEGDEIVPVDTTGHRAEDAMGNYLSIDDVISRNNIYGTVKLDQQKSSPAMRTNSNPSANRGGAYVFKDQNDFAKQYNAIPKTKETKAVRNAMLEAMEAQHPPTKL